MSWRGVNRPILQLALAQALMMSVNTMLITASSIIGFDLAANKSLATLPLAIQFFSTMLTTIPGSFYMKRFGRKSGFILSSIIGLLGGSIAIFSLYTESFTAFCIAAVCFGIYTGFGNFFRFVAPEVAAPGQASTAISYVLAGGVIAAVVGPNLANLSRDVYQLAFLGSFIAVVGLYSLNLINIISMKLPRPVNPALDDIARPLIQIVAQPTFIVALLTALIGFSMMSLLMTATPLAMKHEHHLFSDVAFVIQWHVLGMFAPSFFTGHLINRFGVINISILGAVLILVCIGVNLLGTTLTHFWIALFLLGLGWNFMFIGGTTLLTGTYSEAEKAKAQAINDFSVFSAVTLASLGSGALQHLLGWRMVNISVIPFILLSLVALAWLAIFRRHQTATAN